MPNTFSNLVTDAYAALDVVSRELVGFIPAVQRDATADRIAVGQTLRVGATPANAAAGDVTPAMAFPSAAYQTIGNASLTISKSRFAPFSWQGEEMRAVDSGPGILTLRQGQIAQAMRVLTNEMEADIWTVAKNAASRAYGTAGTTPFASDLSDTAQIRKILDDNGAPMDRSLVIGTTAGAKLRTLTQLTKANEAGTQDTLRAGNLLDLHGFGVRESAQVSTHTKGTGTSYQTNNASGYAVGATTIALDTGSGTILAGDVITFNGDANKYVVTSALSGGSLTIAAPGLRQALADNVAVTVGNTYTGNVAFSRNAILLASRLPYTVEGSLGTVIEVLTDPISGISFELVAYPGIDMVTYHVRAAWGVSAIKPEHIATLLG